MRIDAPEWGGQLYDINGLRLHAVVKGNGPVVLLLHGFPENWYAWRHQINALSKAGFKAVAPDLRGYNKSQRPTNVSDYHIERLCEDVDGWIGLFGNNPVHLVAHDWGGAIAWYYAATRPEKLATLTILNAPHPKLFNQHLRKNPRQLLRSWYMLFFQIPWLPEALIRADLEGTFRRTFKGWAIKKEMFTDEVIEAFAQPMKTSGALTAGINYYRAIFRDTHSFKEAGKFPKIEVDTQVIWADSDRALGKELCDGLEDQMEGHFEIHHIPDCSHWVQQEQPEKVNEYLLDFLTRMKK